MFMPNSAPQYHSTCDSGEYLDQFHAWMIRIGSDLSSRQTLGRLAKVIRVNLLSENDSRELISSLSTLADELNGSVVKKKEIYKHLLRIEMKVNARCPKSRLISKLSSMQREQTSFQPLCQELFIRLENVAFSKIQAEGIMRDLSYTPNSNIKEVEEIFNSWL